MPRALPLSMSNSRSHSSRLDRTRNEIMLGAGMFSIFRHGKYGKYWE